MRSSRRGNLQMPIKLAGTIVCIVATAALSRFAFAGAAAQQAGLEPGYQAAANDSYIRESLDASDLSHRQRRHAQVRFEQHAAALGQICGAASGEERSQRVHEYLHAHVFKRYALAADDVAGTIDRGEYNCVSAAILWSALAEQVGMAVAAVEVPGHVFCQVQTPQGMLLFEPTLPSWRPVQMTAKVPDGDKTPKVVLRVVNRWQLLALQHYNKALRLAEQGRYRDAVLANLVTLRYDPAHPDARQNLLASANDWAMALARSDRWTAACAILSLARLCSPRSPALAQNAAYMQRRLTKITTQRLLDLISCGPF